MEHAKDLKGGHLPNPWHHDRWLSAVLYVHLELTLNVMHSCIVWGTVISWTMMLQDLDTVWAAAGIGWPPLGHTEADTRRLLL